ncbi:MAG: hypothetical protein ACK2TU_03160 [Anaerolineales bacterium]|jgi:hypothetical protein
MFLKIITGVLLTTVIGAGGAAIAYQSSTQETPQTISNQDFVLPEPANDVVSPGVPQPVEPVTAAEGFSGEPWQETGTISEIDDFGFHFSIQNGEQVYVEFGPPDYWQNQGVNLQVGQTVTVKGTNDGDTIHAAQVILADGQTLQLRTEAGQPLWSGGEQNQQGKNAELNNGEHSPEPQAQVDEWVTIEGTVESFLRGSMTMRTLEGELINFKTGQPRFFADQNVTFQAGDQIVVTGFYEGDQFMAGDITQVATGLRVMLRDPNGRALWSGPGNGKGNGRGNGNNT